MTLTSRHSRLHLSAKRRDKLSQLDLADVTKVTKIYMAARQRLFQHAAVEHICKQPLLAVRGSSRQTL